MTAISDKQLVDIDLFKIRLSLNTANQAVEKLEAALERDDERAVGDWLYHVKRELYTIRQLIRVDGEKEMVHDEYTR